MKKVGSIRVTATNTVGGNVQNAKRVFNEEVAKVLRRKNNERND